MNNKTVQFATDTIDLRELFQTLKRRKKIISLITLLLTSLAIIYVWTTKPVYEVKAMIEIGKLESGTKDEKLLDNLGDIKQKLEYIYGVKSKKKRVYPKVKSISLNKQAKSIFTITVEGYSNDEAIELIKKLVKNIEKEYQDKIDTYIKTKKKLIALTIENIKTTKQNLIKIEKTLDNYSQKIMNITAKDAALAGIYTIQISQNQKQAQSLLSKIYNLKIDIYNQELSITPLRLKPTQIVGQIEVQENPIKPKKLLIVIVAFITSLIFSIFLAFFLTFLSGLKNENY